MYNKKRFPTVIFTLRKNLSDFVKYKIFKDHYDLYTT